MRTDEMRQVLRIPGLGAIAGLIMSAVACGGSSNGGSGSGSPPYGGPPPAGAPAVKIATSAPLRNYLVDGNGRALYYYAKDFSPGGAEAAPPQCNRGCPGRWPGLCS